MGIERKKKQFIPSKLERIPNILLPNHGKRYKNIFMFWRRDKISRDPRCIHLFFFRIGKKDLKFEIYGHVFCFLFLERFMTSISLKRDSSSHSLPPPPLSLSASHPSQQTKKQETWEKIKWKERKHQFLTSLSESQSLQNCTRIRR